MNRAAQIESLKREQFDLLVLGGGINGAGVARDLAMRAQQSGRALRVALVEKNYFASGTSGRNSQLIHGGLRYLKNFEFGLVREALRERATLLRIAPHLVKPQPFLIPFYSERERFTCGAGLLLYDMLAGSTNIARHRRLSRDQVRAGNPGLDSRGLLGGAIFQDAQVHSARLVIENIADAARMGAVVANYVAVQGQNATDRLTGEHFRIRARQIVDATGAWSQVTSLRLVRGSHIVVPRLTQGPEAIAYFEPAGRIVFVIPWGETRELSLIGTTDVDHEGGPDCVAISNQEIDYLAGIAYRLFPRASLEIISTYSSLRPLLRDTSSSATRTSRGHRIWRSPDGVIHVAGGKYTTYRSMSALAVDLALQQIAPELIGRCATDKQNLPIPLGDPVERAVHHEMAQQLDDLLFVNTYWGYEQQWTRESLAPIAARMGAAAQWNEARREREVNQFLSRWAKPAAVSHSR